MRTDILKLIGRSREITDKEKEELFSLIERYSDEYKTFGHHDYLILAELIVRYMNLNAKNHDLLFEVDYNQYAKKAEAWYEPNFDKIYLCANFLDYLNDVDLGKAFITFVVDLFHETTHNKQDLIRLHSKGPEFLSANKDAKNAWKKDAINYDMRQRYINQEMIEVIDEFFEKYSKDSEHKFADQTRYKACLLNLRNFAEEDADTPVLANDIFDKNKQILDSYRDGKRVSNKKPYYFPVSFYKRYIGGNTYFEDVNSSHYEQIGYEVDAVDNSYVLAEKFIDKLVKESGISKNTRKWLKTDVIAELNKHKKEAYQAIKEFSGYFDIFMDFSQY